MMSGAIPPAGVRAPVLAGPNGVVSGAADAGGAVSGGAIAGGASARAGKAAEDFEAMAIGQMLRPMFETVDSAHGLFGGGAGEAAWQPVLVEHIARRMAAQGGLGMRQAILAAMLRMQEASGQRAGDTGAADGR